MTEEMKAKFAEMRPADARKTWHQNRGYLDPNCEVCRERSSETGVPLSTADEIVAAKAAWKAARDPEIVAQATQKRLVARGHKPKPVKPTHPTQENHEHNA